jgi:glycosyltransferase involved in cell wall biosynthesis
MHLTPTPENCPSMKPDSILMTAEATGEIWDFCLELTRDLQPHGVEVELATMGRALTPSQKNAARTLENLTLHESSFRLEWMKDPWDEVDQAGRWLLDLEQKLQPNLIHANSPSFAALPWDAPVLVTAHSCLHSWHLAVHGQTPPSPAWGIYRDRIGEGLRRAGLVTAPTQNMLDTLQRLHGPFQAAKPVPQGRSSAEFHAQHREPFILAAGPVWDEGKNFRILEAASRGLDWPVYLAGEERHPDGSTVHLDGVHPLGDLPERELAQWMGRASIFVHPALYEPFGQAPLEAALAGCCLLLGEIPTLREVWDGAALFVPPRETATLQKAMQHLIIHYRHRQRLRDLAHDRALQFTPERTTEGYLELYSNLLQDASLHPMTALR